MHFFDIKFVINEVWKNRANSEGIIWTVSAFNPKTHLPYVSSSFFRINQRKGSKNLQGFSCLLKWHFLCFPKNLWSILNIVLSKGKTLLLSFFFLKKKITIITVIKDQFFVFYLFIITMETYSFAISTPFSKICK